MPKFTTINDGLLAHYNKMADDGYEMPNYDQDVSSVIMAIADAYETELSSEQAATLPTFAEMDRHQPGDAIFRLLSILDMLIQSDEEEAAP